MSDTDFQIRQPRIPDGDSAKEEHFAQFAHTPTPTLGDWLTGIKRAHLYTPSYKKARDQVVSMAERLPGEEGVILAIMGPSQAGKTHILERLVTFGRWQEQLTHAAASSRLHRPVIYLSNPTLTAPSPARALAEAILTQLNRNEDVRGQSETFIIDRLLPAALDEHGVKVVVIDELSTSIEDHSEPKLRKTAHALRKFVNRSGKGRVNIIIAGLHEPLEKLLLASNETFNRTVKVRVSIFTRRRSRNTANCFANSTIRWALTAKS